MPHHLRENKHWKLITKYELWRWCFSMNFSKILRIAILKENLAVDIPYLFKEHLWMSAFDEATLKKNFGGSKPSSKLTLETKWYHICSCCDDSCREQLKKYVTDKYFEKGRFWTLITFHYRKCMLHKRVGWIPLLDEIDTRPPKQGICIKAEVVFKT